MMLIPLLLAIQIGQPRQPVLSFPDPRLDDSAAYQGYETKFYRDAAGNSVQIYKDGRSGRVVHLLANADNESIGLTVRGDTGIVPVSWGSETAQVAARSGFRTLSHTVTAQSRHVHLGWFLL